MGKGELTKFVNLLSIGSVNLDTLYQDEIHEATWNTFLKAERPLPTKLSAFYIYHCEITERKKNPDFITQSLGLAFLIALRGKKEEREVMDDVDEKKKKEMFSFLNSQLFLGEVGMETFAYNSWNSNQGMLLNLRSRHKIGTITRYSNGVPIEFDRIWPNQVTIKKDLTRYVIDTLDWFSHEEGVQMMEKAELSGKYSLIRPYHTMNEDAMLLNLVATVPEIPRRGVLLIPEHDAIIQTNLKNATKALSEVI